MKTPAPRVRCAHVLCFLALAASANPATSESKLQGVWASVGYGRILEIRSDTISTFDVTRISCVDRETRPLREFLRGINRINLSERRKFSYYDEGGITRYDFTRLDRLPETCLEAKTAETVSDPEYNFEVFWHSFNENYAFFDVHGIDWDEVYRDFRPRITNSTTDRELYDMLTRIIGLLDDRHVSLQSPDFPRRYSGHPGTLQKLLQKEIPEGEEANREKVNAAVKPVIAEYYLQSSIQRAVDGQFTWGWAAEEIGYFSIDSMSGYVDEENATLRDSLELVDEVMDQVIRDLKGAKGIIVDARWNGGGEDANALQIAGHFTDQQLLALTKRAKVGDSLAPEQEIFIPWHAEEVFSGPVVYLCSSDTLSAAEIFSMAMMAIPNVTTLGEPTVGALSDTHSVYLPNGWQLRLSNEVYKAIDGVVYEGAGIPVDVHLPASEDSTLTSYIKLGMDTAIAMLEDDD